MSPGETAPGWPGDSDGAEVSVSGAAASGAAASGAAVSRTVVSGADAASGCDGMAEDAATDGGGDSGDVASPGEPAGGGAEPVVSGDSSGGVFGSSGFMPTDPANDCDGNSKIVAHPLAATYPRPKEIPPTAADATRVGTGNSRSE